MSEKGEAAEFVAGPDDAGRRLDRVLKVILKELSLGDIYSALRRGRIRINGAKTAPSYRVEAGDRIRIPADLSPTTVRNIASIAVHSEGDGTEAERLGDLLVLASHDLLFLNKPRGLLAQGPGGLEDIVRTALSSRSAASLSFSPGPLHRLDRNTSGLIVFPRSAAGARAFSALLRMRRVRKRYLALLEGKLPGPETWSDSIERDGAARKSRVAGGRESGDERQVSGGTEARALACPLVFSRGLSLASIELGTGMTHQIRVQAASRGHPLAGDTKYGGSPFAGGYLLHAHSLEFPEPPFSDLPRTVEAPLSVEIRTLLDRLFGAREIDIALTKALET